MMMGGTAIALAALGFHIIRTQWFVASQTNTQLDTNNSLSWRHAQPLDCDYQAGGMVS